MKKRYGLFFCAVISAFLISCATNAAERWHADAKNHGAFNHYAFNETFPLVAGLGASSPMLKFHAALLDVTSANAGTRLLLNKTLYEGKDCRQYADEEFNRVKKKYLNSKPDNATLASRAASFNWEYDETGTGWLYKSILVLKRTRYIIEGGANGIDEQEYFVLDTAAGKRIRLSDLLPQSNYAELTKHAEAALKTTYAAKNGLAVRPGTTLSSLGFFNDKVELPEENFYVTPESLHFVWNQYLIAPRVFGAVEAVIPYNNIEKLLSDNGKAVFAAMQTK